MHHRNLRADHKNHRNRLTKILLLYAVCWTIGIGLLCHLWGGVVSADTKRGLYVVEQGDTIWSIASQMKHGGDPRGAVNEIMEINHLQSADIHPGDTLVLPNP
jgi:LysM domain